MVEFAYNSAKSKINGLLLFEANYRMSTRQLQELLNKTPYMKPASTLLEQVWKGTWDHIRENILGVMDSVDTTSLYGQQGIADYYCSKVASWQER